jgi:hypothetical protein
MILSPPKAFAAWDKLMNDINHKEVDLIVSISDLKKLQKTKVFKL